MLIPCNSNAVIINSKHLRNMKKFFGLVAFVCLFAAMPASAQLNFGIKAGVNLSERPALNLNDLKSSLKGSTGWFAGPTAKFIFPVIGLGVEANVLYSQSNIEVEGQKIMNQSVDIPLYLRYEITIPVINKFFEPFVAIGPQFEWNIGNKQFTLENLKNTDYSKYTLKESCISLNLGLGFILLDHYQLHGNYNLTLGKTAEISSLDVSKVVELKNSKWQISLAYIF